MLKSVVWFKFVMISSLLMVAGVSVHADNTGEVLHNGIVLPAEWPPKYKDNTRRPMPVPYLESPPAVIPINIGRQLFVDDFLIERTDLQRTHHAAEYHPASPVLTVDQPWESAGPWRMAAPFSDGVWWDAKRQRFVLWYLTGDLDLTCYAESKDGIHWTKPDVGIEAGTNIVRRGPRDSSAIWLDHNEADPQRRFKMTTFQPGVHFLQLQSSPDGIHWSEVESKTRWRGDRTTFHYNPFRNVWAMSLRATNAPRRRNYHEHENLAQLLDTLNENVPWVGADELDRTNPDYPNQVTQIYTHDAIAYESLMLGLFSVYLGPENRECARLGIQKHNEVQVGFSRDGFHWDRPNRDPFLGVDKSDGAWNWGNVQSVGGGVFVMGDKLYFYVSGRALNDEHWNGHWDGQMTTGLGILRRDGFASMDAGQEPGTLTTRPLTFKDGKHLFVNVDAPEGELRVEILDESGQPIAPFTLERCDVVAVDSTRMMVSWGGDHDLSALRGTPVRLRFELQNGSLYAFWVSTESSGISNGYVAAGGSEFAGDKDDGKLIQE